MQVRFTAEEVESVNRAKRERIGEVQCQLNEAAAMEADYATIKELAKRARGKFSYLRFHGAEFGEDGSITISLGPRYC